MKRWEKILHFLEVHWQSVTLSAVCVCLSMVALAALDNQTSEVFSGSDWGLNFVIQGAAPQGNVGAETLKEFDAYYIGNTDEKTIYLTFDAGYENGYTKTILDVLKKHEVKATFFLVEHYMKTAPELVLRMADEGHIVANHTASHPDMSTLTSAEALRAELTPVEVKYREITGRDMIKLYRPPQGKFSELNLRHAQQLGYTTVFWSLAYVDWNTAKQPDPKSAIQKLNARIHNGAIVLLHSTSATNAAILDELIRGWKDMGYTVGSLEDFVK